MLKSSQRSALKAMANKIEPVIYIGKAGITENVIKLADEALEARELVKGTVQQNSPVSAKEALEILARGTDAYEVSSTGRKFVMYRRRKKDPEIMI